MTKKVFKKDGVRYCLDRNGCFVIENYNQSRPFSSFFPGIAGAWGIPLWCFYVNRGQCISSFGIEGKDKAILEFQPANKAYRLTSLQGFRTFLKINTGKKLIFWEPFQTARAGIGTQQKLYLTAHDLTLEDYHPTLGLIVRVNYFTMPEDDFPALVRRVNIESVSRKQYSFELIDGLPVILPYGVRDWLAKNLSRTVEAWMEVGNIKKKTPFYHLSVEVSDSAVVNYIHEGNFYFSFDPQAPQVRLLKPIVESAQVFGQSSDLIYPQKFFDHKIFRISSEQQTANRTPSAMCFDRFLLSSGHSKEFVSLVGHADSIDHLNKIVSRLTKKGVVDKKAELNKKVIAHVQNFAFTHSSSPQFNLYCGQTFLDNVLRGGLPTSIETDEGAIAFNIYSRKHGDLERDYNYFTLAPTYFSQGNGNYRDVNQNRRNDIWFNKDVRENSIVEFLNLIQPDGYNPLVVKGLSFVIDDLKVIDRIFNDCVQSDASFVREYLESGFQPGGLLSMLNRRNIVLKVSVHEFLYRVIAVSRRKYIAEHGEGFWSDHWTYNLDLIESYLLLYPENVQYLLFEHNEFHFYHNTHYVVPRSERYMINSRGVVRQYHSVKDGKEDIQTDVGGNFLRINNGLGDVYSTILMVKLLCLAVNKAATLDPSGSGIEMEADRPNWYDALNGLPGLSGSSISELFELKRLCLFMLDSMDQARLAHEYSLKVFSELSMFASQLLSLLSQNPDAYEYWQKANDFKEAYRLSVREGIEGSEVEFSLKELKKLLTLIVLRLDRGINSVQDKKGLFPTYFYHKVTEYETLHERDQHHARVRPLIFKRHSLPYFLEGFVHAMKVQGDLEGARKLYQRIKRSALFDKSLKMYKVNSDLSGETEEIGRARNFPSGWLENESIWLHMEYKYVLELLRSGLYDEFYETFQEVLIPFQDPVQYGRSNLENSSFIVSSAHGDPALHGMGFVARLSGSTAEFLHIWLYMNVGPKPFLFDGHSDICLSFQPILAGWLFTKKEMKANYLSQERKWQTLILPKNTYAFQFLGSILVVYHNSRRRNTYGKHACRIQHIVLTYPGSHSQVKISGSIIPSLQAQEIRNREVERIDVFFD